MTEAFERAVKEVDTLNIPPDSPDDFMIYGLFKQATVGDINQEHPGLLDISAKMKWEAWNRNKGLSKDDAKAAFVEVVDMLKKKCKP
ncbi:acyl-CoA-binding protein-like isoform X1 [Halichoeres trimaculatus]|uniref:acyl-CoA-binding protein-like isoform X1 n=1 Tax=Halichoeres trimaculatus TaxID=147232 RepID=UPI003D9E429B